MTNLICVSFDHQLRFSLIEQWVPCGRKKSETTWNLLRLLETIRLRDTSTILRYVQVIYFNYIIISCTFRQEMVLRDVMRKADEAEKAAIIQAKFAESSARHEYAAQHPAYADGRIW